MQDLEELAGRLDFIQNNALQKLDDTLATAQTSYDRDNVMDLRKLLELDISTRATIKNLSGLLSSTATSADVYARFMYTSGSVISMMDQCHVPLDLLGAFRMISTAVNGAQRLSLSEIFTIVSVIMTTAALCLPQLQTGTGRDVILRLDQLLEIKSEQLQSLL